MTKVCQRPLARWRARPQNIEFLLEVGLCLEVEYVAEERSMGKRSIRRETWGRRRGET